MVRLDGSRKGLCLAASDDGAIAVRFKKTSYIILKPATIF